jgi:hypothetical protein
MRGKPKKAAPKGGAKRHISHIKRTNQKRNKLVKQGKAKPLNSTPRYIPNQAKKAQQENTITPWQPSEQEVKGRYPQLFSCSSHHGNKFNLIFGTLFYRILCFFDTDTTLFLL